MNWKLEFRPEVELDVREAAVWYERREEGLGSEFVEEIIRAWDRRRLWTAGILIPSFVSALGLF